MGSIYSIKCPKCSARAAAYMHPTGRTGTYREPMHKMGAKRIVCKGCGLTKEVSPDESDNYELWYATGFKGNRLWAKNRGHLTMLISWLSGNRSRPDFWDADRPTIECLPKWMILARNRAGVLKRLNELLKKDLKKTAPPRKASNTSA